MTRFTIINPNIVHHCACTTRRLTSIGVQKSIFLSTTSGGHDGNHAVVAGSNGEEDGRRREGAGSRRPSDASHSCRVRASNREAMRYTQRREKELTMRWEALLVAAMMAGAPALAAAQDADAQTCTALVMPSVTGAQGSAADLAGTTRDLFATYLSGPTLRSVPLDARLPSQAVEEARQKNCGRVLVVKLTQKTKGAGSSVGKAVGQAAGTAAYYLPGGGVGGAVARTTAAATASAVSSIASGTRAKDELLIDYTLSTVDGRTLLTRTDRAKAQADREDLLTPLVERASIAIAAAPSK